MDHGAFHHIGDGLDAPVGVHGKARHVFFGIRSVKGVQQEQGIGVVHGVAAEDVGQVHAGAVDARLAFDGAFYFSYHSGSFLLLLLSFCFLDTRSPPFQQRAFFSFMFQGRFSMVYY